MKNKLINSLTLLFAFLLSAGLIFADEKAGEEINWQVISSGGNLNSASPNFKMSATVAQTTVGSGSSSNFGLKHGFWQEFGGGTATCCDVPGDANNDGVVNILDITYLINYLYMGGPAPPCMYEGDANGDCTVNILDITYLIDYLYQGGPAPICAPNCPGW